MILDNIIRETRARIAANRKQYSQQLLENEVPFRRADRFADQFKKDAINIITELKYGSPSRGHIFDPADLAPLEVVKQYMENGAMALSILTEPTYFHGSYDYLTAARRAYPHVPIIMKDFYVDPYQFYLARYLGASIALLVVRYYDKAQLRDFFQLAGELDLDTLVEVHDMDELEQAIELGCPVIGVNNRNLKTLSIDLETSRALSKAMPEDKIRICESGIYTRAEIDEFREMGYDGFLVGTSLMENGNPGEALRGLIGTEN